MYFLFCLKISGYYNDIPTMVIQMVAVQDFSEFAKHILGQGGNH